MLHYLVTASLALFGAFYTGAAIMKLMRHPHFIEEFEKMKLPYALAYLSAGVEIFMGPALVTGIWLPWVAGLAAAFMFCTMLGAALVNYMGRGAVMAVGVLVVFASPMALLALYHLPDVSAFLGV